MVGAAPVRAAADRARRRSPALRKKLWRDMRQNAMQFVTIILLCALGTWVYSGLDGTWRMLDLSAETYFRQGELADLWVNLEGVDRQDLANMANTPGVADVQGRFSADMDCPELGEDVSLNVHAFDGVPRINVPLCVEGTLLEDKDARGILLQEEFAQANGLGVGDTLRLDVPGREQTFVIRGLINDAEHVITSKDVTPEPAKYGYAVICWEAVKNLPLNEAVVRLAEGADGDQVERALQALLPQSLILTHQTHASTQRTRGDVGIFQNLTLVFPILAYLVAAMVVLTTLTRMIENQRVQMGTLKALGYRDAQIRRHYLCYALVPSTVGALLGTMVGRYTLPDMLYAMETAHYFLPEKLRAPISPAAWGMTALMVILSAAICLYAYQRAARENTAELLRPKPPKAGNRVLLERWHGLWGRFSFNSKMVVRNFARNRWRTLMAMVGVLCCNMLMICAMGLQDSVDACVGEYYMGIVGYDLRVDLDASAAGTLESYRSRLDAAKVEGIMERSVSLRRGETSRTVLLTVLEEEQTMLRYGAEHTVVPLTQDGLAISRKLMEVMGLSLGDQVELWFPGEDDSETLTLTQVVDTTMNQGVFLPRESWEKLRRGSFRPTALLLLQPTELCRWRLSQAEEVTAFKDPVEQYAQTMTLMDSMTGVFNLMYFAALGLAFVICYNMGLMNFTERVRDYATLKVLGYRQGEICRLMMRETWLIALLGMALGIYPGLLLTQAVMGTVQSETMVYTAHVAPMSIILSGLITLAFSLCIEWLLTRKVRGIHMVEALKSVE